MKAIKVILLCTSLLVSVLLFYIDEGNYHLDGLFKLGNIVALSFYFIGIFVTKLILVGFFRTKLSAQVTLPVVIITGSVLGSLLVAGFFIFGIPAIKAIG